MCLAGFYDGGKLGRGAYNTIFATVIILSGDGVPVSVHIH